MKALSYTLVDVFTEQKFGGNQLAVFHEESSLTQSQMQAIARELNLSETVFILPASNDTADRKLRIFTPQLELPMAGHPTIGAAFVLAEEERLETREGINTWLFEEGVGEIPVTVYKENSRITKIEMNQPIPVFGDRFDDRQTAADLLSIAVEDIHTDFPVQTISSGVPFLYIPLRSLSAMKQINFRTDVWQKTFATHPHTQHIFAFTTETMEPGATVHSRMFAPAMGIAEDPATGAASGPLGAYLVEHSMIPLHPQGIYRIHSEQGWELGRPSQIEISITKEAGEYKEVKIGGNCVKIGSGQLYID